MKPDLIFRSGSYIFSKMQYSNTLQRNRRGGRVVECTSLENWHTVFPYRGFESPPLRQWELPTLLIHCRAGMSRSPAITLAIFADWLGEGREEEAVGELLKTAPLCTPNQLVVETADRVLGVY